MNAAGRSARNALIARMHQQRVPQVEIARKVGLEPPRVHRILRTMGALPPKRDLAGAPGGTRTVWDHKEGDSLRMAIWRRQHQAARQRLAEMEQSDA